MTSLNDTFLNMGGDGSRFKVSFEEKDEPVFTISDLRVVLLSDAYAENSI